MGRKKILIVDDDKDFGESLSENLKFKGFETDIAYNATEALNLIEQVAYRAIVMDIIMPGQDGVECLEKILDVSPKVPIWMMTGYSLPEKIKEAMDLGAKGILAKPIRFPELVNKLTDLPCLPC